MPSNDAAARRPRSNPVHRHFVMVPVEGIEPTLLAEHDFESCASTSSATRALSPLYIFDPHSRPSTAPARQWLCVRLQERHIAPPAARRRSNAGDETAMTQATMTKRTWIGWVRAEPA